jgi:hypothetical protein
LTLFVEFPMPIGIPVGRVQNRSIEEWIAHELMLYS